ncbi:hypothetical protein PGT21_023891 [Puccinia graminis f. sp. tritici]|uniref:Uncharacterized protein n=1 Tax=Puccinia graminis f. sp. tritici TaxID=56615 RepID=A0A5B0PJ06_PUCGR|nr:hypothetical protein PGT21_023891 [Puccinia graminis f. sp. tritici]KAA1123493.1 hypothetical protein PGTUg99_020937 [Puccinia graminis f. sp. tritici]
MDNPLDEVGPQIKHLGDLVIQGFGKLKDKYQTHRSTNQVAGTTQAVINDRANSREIHYDRLHSSLLPQLKEKLVTISRLLEPQDIWEEPEARLRRLLEIIPELDSTLSQIHFSTLIVCPGTLFSASQTNDQDLKEFKTFRLIKLKGTIDHMLWNLCSVCNSASIHIEIIELSTGGLFMHVNESSFYGSYRQALRWIRFTISQLKGSELDVVEECRKIPVLSIDKLLQDTLSILTPSAPKTRYFQRKLTQQAIIELTKLSIPIIKLFKLFFKKLSREGMNNKKSLKLPLFTQMNSNQIEALSQSAGKISGDLSELVRLLTQADLTLAREPNTIDNRPIIKIAERLPTHFDGPLLSIVLYIVPLIDPLSDQDYYHTWFVTWNILINCAIHNFLQLARTFD